MNFKHLLAVAAVAACSAASAASYDPVGVQLNVADSTVFGGGWQVAFVGDYGTQDNSLAAIMAKIPAGANIMLAAQQVGSTSFALLAEGDVADVTQHTGLNAPHLVNGAEWYWNAYSVGFALAGDSIQQNEADVSGTDSQYRLSWHATVDGNWQGFDPNATPDYIDAGWRAGNVTGLNSGSTGWDRYVLFQTAVPESTSSAMMVAGLALVGGLLRRRKANAA